MLVKVLKKTNLSYLYSAHHAITAGMPLKI